MKRTIELELREQGKTLHGVVLTEGVAAENRREVFSVGALKWASTGIEIRERHKGPSLCKAFPVRNSSTGAVTITCPATPEIRAAVNAGRNRMSIEFRSIEERTTAGGIRQVESAWLEAAALTDVPEYVHGTRAEVRDKRRRIWL